jgi:hypothetical protein
MADTDGRDNPASKDYANILDGIEVDGTIPQRSRDNG